MENWAPLNKNSFSLSNFKNLKFYKFFENFCKIFKNGLSPAYCRSNRADDVNFIFSSSQFARLAGKDGVNGFLYVLYKYHRQVDAAEKRWWWCHQPNQFCDYIKIEIKNKIEIDVKHVPFDGQRLRSFQAWLAGRAAKMPIRIPWSWTYWRFALSFTLYWTSAVSPFLRFKELGIVFRTFLRMCVKSRLFRDNRVRSSRELGLANKAVKCNM